MTSAFSLFFMKFILCTPSTLDRRWRKFSDRYLRRPMNSFSDNFVTNVNLAPEKLKLGGRAECGIFPAKLWESKVIKIIVNINRRVLDFGQRLIAIIFFTQPKIKKYQPPTASRKYLPISLCKMYTLSISSVIFSRNKKKHTMNPEIYFFLVKTNEITLKRTKQDKVCNGPRDIFFNEN